MFGSTRLSAAGWAVLGLTLVLASGCSDKRPSLAALDPGCHGPLCQEAGAGGDGGLELTLACDLPPEAQGLIDETLQPKLAEQPATCEEAIATKSYVGCDFWPTVTPNIVANIYDFTVVVANTGDTAAEAVVTYGDDEVARATVQPSSLAKLYLPWVDALKASVNECGQEGAPALNSRLVRKGAYHLTSDRPVVAYQFSPLEFQSMGGPPGKDWSKCDEYTYTNDASLLLPIQAMGTSYRTMTLVPEPDQLSHPTLTITAPSDGTTVKLYPLAKLQVAPGSGVPLLPAGDPHEFALDAGDVVMLAARSGALAGMVVEADQPVQAIGGDSCADVPNDVAACDHLEETLPPAASLGRRYLIAPPTGPASKPLKYALELHGNQDDTKLYYLGEKPRTAPDTLAAGQTVFIANIAKSFELVGSHELGVSLFLQGGELELRGETDPSQSIAIPVEQYRRRYVFLAPNDYTVNYADVIAPSGTEITVDGVKTDVKREAFSCSRFEVMRIFLDSANGGVHVLEASEAVGVQVIGHASYTSYQYPGGLNTSEIAPPPMHPPVK